MVISQIVSGQLGSRAVSQSVIRNQLGVEKDSQSSQHKQHKPRWTVNLVASLARAVECSRKSKTSGTATPTNQTATHKPPWRGVGWAHDSKQDKGQGANDLELNKRANRLVLLLREGPSHDVDHTCLSHI